jgi:hypothetical protein
MARASKKDAAAAPEPKAAPVHNKRVDGMNLTDAKRVPVELLAAVGVPQADIAVALKRSRRTIAREFLHELANGGISLHL